jgi:hypothetical protein
LVLMEGGYTLGLKVADELHLTVPVVTTKSRAEGTKASIQSSPRLQGALRDTRSFTNPFWTEEAFTHPTCLHPDTILSAFGMDWRCGAVPWRHVRVALRNF